MSSEKIQRVGIIGAGQMGAGIAEVWAPAPNAKDQEEHNPAKSPAPPPAAASARR
ncbi:hypothetical protein [Nocardia brasiliensis]|uniref:hypothetical protein n=1 Tax=Nocardia brasiliensis TaxID=37326 RepID=UPI002455B677|nr:hypothetical protein [Nocardia brasiliensis]